MAIFLTAAILFILPFIYTAEACPADGKTAPDGRCLWVVSEHQPADPIDHDSASRECQTNGGQLPTVKTAEKERVIRELANEKLQSISPRHDAIYVWINLQRDVLEENSDKGDMSMWQQRENWKWKDNDETITEEMWRFWNTQGNEPNNFRQRDEYCVVATVSREDGDSSWKDATCPDITWYDGTTSYPMLVICEKP